MFQPKLQIKHDWYQTESAVVITILIKNLKEEYLHVDFNPAKVGVTISIPEFEVCDLCFNLSHEIVPNQSSFKLSPSKVSTQKIQF